MLFEARFFPMKDGRTCILRPTHPNDSADMIEYLKKTSAETPFLLRNPDEVNYTMEQEAEILSNILNDPGHVMMVGIVDGKVAGNCAISGLGSKRKIRHRCSMAITLYKEFWNLGIGSAMIEYLAELAGQIGYEQMELEVVAENERAIALYEKCGFRETGRNIRAMKFDDGTYHDLILMTRILNGPVNSEK